MAYFVHTGQLRLRQKSQKPLPQNLSDKEQSFAAHYVQSGDALLAYKSSYKYASYSPDGVKKKALRLLQKPDIKAYIKSLQQRDEEYSSIEKNKLNKMLLRAYEKAADDKRGASAMISACLAIAKLNNLENTLENTQTNELSDLIKEARQRLQHNKEKQSTKN
jgi:phage terminase small subunit